MSTIKINVFRDGGVWFGARWINDEYDGCDALDIDDGASESEAIETAASMPLTVAGERTVAKVDDINTQHQADAYDAEQAEGTYHTGTAWQSRDRAQHARQASVKPLHDTHSLHQSTDSTDMDTKSSS